MAQDELLPPPADPALDSPVTLCLSVTGCGTLSAWSQASAERRGEEVLLQLQHDQTVVIGRQEGGRTPYLDPHYLPTRLLPNTGVAVVGSKPSREDSLVSRAHFMLKGAAGGIRFINGVPQRGGGIRVPINGTWLIGDELEWMRDAREVEIRRGDGCVTPGRSKSAVARGPPSDCPTGR
jgi:hypothetical protein